jgi:hypothetical protein
LQDYEEDEPNDDLPSDSEFNREAEKKKRISQKFKIKRLGHRKHSLSAKFKQT